MMIMYWMRGHRAAEGQLIVDLTEVYIESVCVIELESTVGFTTHSSDKRLKPPTCGLLG